MSLSLEVKKFINSEHTGEFVNVTLPSELPVRREEVRTVHRDTAAAESAKRRARDLANARESAKRAAQSAEEALSDAHRDERAAEKELRERQSRRSALTPEYDEKNGIAAAAQSLFNQRKAESDRCYAVYSEFEKALRKAETDSNAAHTAAAGCRAALENAETAHRNAVETEMRLHKQLEELRNDSAQTEVLAAKTDRESEEFRKAESEKASIVAELNAEAVRLAGEKRALEKQIADAERSLAKLGRDLQKTKSDRTALTQQLDALKTAANGKKGADKDAAMQKVNAAKTKADAAAETEKQQTSEHSALASECAALREKLTECERCVAENDEKLRSARHEYDMARAQTAAMNEESTGRKAALAGKNATLDALAAQLENAKLRIVETEKAEAAARSAAAAAEVEAARLKTALDTANERAAEKKKIYADAKALTDASDEDVLILSDVDEIPNPVVLHELVKRFDPDKIYHLAQRNFYCYLNMEEVSGNLLSITGEFPGVERRMWLGTKVFAKKNIPESGIIDLREISPEDPRSVRVADGGWHFGYMGSCHETDVSRRVGTKVVAAAHQEYNTEDVLAEVKDRLILGEDIFGRNAVLQWAVVDESYPQYLLEHKSEYDYLIMPPISRGKKAFVKIWMLIKRFCRKVRRRIRRIL